MGLRLETRLAPNARWQALSVLLALLASGIVTAILLKSAGTDVWAAFTAIYDGAFGDLRATSKSLAKSTPFILTGLAITVAFRAKVWNIGAEGQLFAGAMSSYWLYSVTGPAMGMFLLPLLFVAGFVGGGLYGGLAGYLRSAFRVNEVLTTVMLNYVILYLLSFLLVGPWRDQSSFYQQSSRIDRSVWLPDIWAPGKLHVGFLIALVAAVVVYIIMSRSWFGYEVKAVGLNARAARFKGINVERTAVAVMAISGGLAGLAGVIQVFGVNHRLETDISLGFGYTGIIIAVLAMLNPMWVVFVAILFGAFENGAIKMQVATGVPSAITSAIEAITLLFFLTAAVLARHRIVWDSK
ncbi:MAG: ABC transporter permease [Rhodobacterales bacterium]|nr:ABC transporter permease [Rhodobacterales bacterium]